VLVVRSMGSTQRESKHQYMVDGTRNLLEYSMTVVKEAPGRKMLLNKEQR